MRGTPVPLAEGHKPVLIYPGAWLGISFVALVLFVLVFTNARARGVKSLVLFLLLIVVGLVVQMTAGWTEILQVFPLLLVHMNLAFYLLFSGVLLAAWLLVVIGTDPPSIGSSGPTRSPRNTGSPMRPRATPRPRSRPRARATTSSCTACWGCGSSASAPATSDPLQHRRQRPEGIFLKNVWRAAYVEKEINRLVA